MLILAYKHIEEEDEALELGNIPLDPDNGYSHQHVAGFGGYAESLIESVRFYCTSDGNEGRIMHFKTSHTVQIKAAWDGALSVNSAGDWTDGELLSDHNAVLPAGVVGDEGDDCYEDSCYESYDQDSTYEGDTGFAGDWTFGELLLRPFETNTCVLLHSSFSDSRGVGRQLVGHSRSVEWRQLLLLRRLR